LINHSINLIASVFADSKDLSTLDQVCRISQADCSIDSDLALSATGGKTQELPTKVRSANYFLAF